MTMANGENLSLEGSHPGIGCDNDGSLPFSENDQSSAFGVAEEEKENPIAKKETRAVAGLKILVLIVLVLSALAVALTIYYYVANSEESEFEDNFNSDAHKVLEAIGKSLEKTLKGLDSLAVSMVSHARATGQKWPFVTIPDYAMRAAKILALTELLMVVSAPIVTNETRLQWENYTVHNDYWVNESVALQEKFDLYHGDIGYANASNPVLYGDFGDVPYNVSRLMMPDWQQYPQIPVDGFPTYNWDWLDLDPQYSGGIRTMLEKQTVVLGDAFLLPDPNDPDDVTTNEIWANFLKNYVQPGEPYDEPASDLHFPIFDTVDQIRSPSSKEDHNPHEQTLVGALVATLFWRKLLDDILPPQSDGVVVVIENPCNPTFTYQINGPRTEFLGRGDHHDTEYDDQRISAGFFDLHSFSVGSSLYSGPPLDQEFCPFTFNLYPSDDMHEDFSTNNGLIFAVCAVLIFVFTSFVFLMYDCTVERRQRVVMNTAERSTAIVSSLFPSEVRDRLADDVVDSKKKKRQQQPANNKVQEFLDSGEESGDNQRLVRDSPPIASNYPETTVMFGDIAGFTKWSSTRQPTEVFVLLESLYGAFDRLADRHRVFKVETIGDCYVAVVGLPKPRKSHAVVMARFARDCRNVFSQVTRELEPTLGSDTLDLALRTGLHSGATTAGVLRGAKSRFQLFGDTVNTSARMESNGERNRIHVSQATADLLIASGKESWLTKREDLVQAKGKGAMQTYWVEPTSLGTASIGTSSAISDLVDGYADEEDEDELQDHNDEEAEADSPSTEFIRNKLGQRLASYKGRGNSSRRLDDVSV